MIFNEGNIVVRKYSKCPGRDLDKHSMCNLLNECKKLASEASSGRNSDAKQLWFGDCGESNSTDIDDRFTKLSQFLDGLEKFTFVSSSADPDSAASFPMKSEHKVEGGMPLHLLTSRYKRSAFIRIGPKFFSLDQKDKLLTLIHELAHMTMGAEDVDFPVGNIEMYGEHWCKELADTAPELAYKNADNWAYYCSAYMH